MEKLGCGAVSDQCCRRCGVPHAEHPDASADGGMGRVLPWRDGRCPACLDRRSELAARGARRYADAVLAGDDYVVPSEPGQATLGEVLG